MLNSTSMAGMAAISSTSSTGASPRRSATAQIAAMPAGGSSAAVPRAAPSGWNFSQMKPQEMKAWAQQAMAQGEISLQGYIALTAMPATLRPDASGGMSVVPFSELPEAEQPQVDYLGMVSGHLAFLRQNPAYAQKDPPALWQQLLGAMQARQGASRSQLDVLA